MCISLQKSSQDGFLSKICRDLPQPPLGDKTPRVHSSDGSTRPRTSDGSPRGVIRHRSSRQRSSDGSLRINVGDWIVRADTMSRRPPRDMSPGSDRDFRVNQMQFDFETVRYTKTGCFVSNRIDTPQLDYCRPT